MTHPHPADQAPHYDPNGKPYHHPYPVTPSPAPTPDKAYSLKRSLMAVFILLFSIFGGCLFVVGARATGTFGLVMLLLFLAGGIVAAYKVKKGVE